MGGGGGVPEVEGEILLRATWDLPEEEKPVAYLTGTNERLGRMGSDLANIGSAFKPSC